MSERVDDLRHTCQRCAELEEEANAYLATALQRQQERDEARRAARRAARLAHHAILMHRRDQRPLLGAEEEQQELWKQYPWIATEDEEPQS